MIKVLIDNKKKFYKANLHCHSNISDGNLTPVELKNAYIEQGYSIIAYTDHELFLNHNHLTDKNFLALNGTELAITDNDKDFVSTKTCHLCMIAKSPKMDIHPLWNRNKYCFANNHLYKQYQKYDESKPDYERKYNCKCINEMIKIAKKSGFFVTYNHPEWSLEEYPQYSKYRGMNAMEIYNSGCSNEGWDEDNGYVYDNLLRQSKKLYILACDDNHDHQSFQSPYNDSFKGYTVINAKKLEYTAITKALFKGNFYASTGLGINSLTYDNETKSVHIECDPCDKISLLTDIRANITKMSFKNDLMTSADFVLNPKIKYFRIRISFEGKKAFTNAYFIKNL